MVEFIKELDKALFLHLNENMGSVADTVFWLASSKVVWVPLYLLILYFVYRRFGLKNMFIFLAAVALTVVLADQVCNIFKYGFKKLRPTHTPDIKAIVHIVNDYRGGLYGTFSAHCATCFAIAIMSAKTLRNPVFTIFIYFWAVFVAYSRIYLGVHFPLDLIFGTATGLIFGYFGYWLLDKYALKQNRYEYEEE